jgi:hypothetical protein
MLVPEFIVTGVPVAEGTMIIVIIAPLPIFDGFEVV